MMIREILNGSVEHEAEVALRNAVLREPLGLEFTAEEQSQESLKTHVGAFESDKLVGCVLIHPLKNGEWKLSQMAVSPAHQGKGVGRELVRAAEQVCLEKGGTVLILNARETAAGFYESCGYRKTSELFELIGLPHVIMRKELSA